MKAWFDIGSATPGKKISTARMLHLLGAKFPIRYYLPTEKQINALITKFSGDEKKARVEAAQGRVNQGDGISEMHGPRENAGNRRQSRYELVIMPKCSDGANGEEEGDVEMTTASTVYEPFIGERLGVGSDGVSMEQGVVNGSEVSFKAKRKRTCYQMPMVYAEFLRISVVNDKKFKRCDVRKTMTNALGLSGKTVPADFLSDHQVKKRVSYLRGVENKNGDKTK